MNSSLPDKSPWTENLPESLGVIICEYIGINCEHAAKYCFGTNFYSYKYLYNFIRHDDETYNRKKIRYLMAPDFKNIYKYRNVIHVHLQKPIYDRISFTLENMYGIIDPIAIPKSFTSLDIDNVDYIEANVIPDTIKYLSFGYFFNQILDEHVLPNSLTHLTFGNSYNQPFKKHVLPNSLTHLTFGHTYNQPFKKHVLPNSLTHLTFGHEYNQPFNSVLPNSLRYLDLGGSFSQPIFITDIPTSLEHIGISKFYSYKEDLIMLAELFSFTITYYH